MSDEKVLAARWSPENHLASKQWMLAKEEDSGRSVLVVDCDDERVLPVFGGEGEAEIFVWLEGTFEDGWKVRETSAGELVSMLHGPFARVTRVALDRAPEMVGMYAVSLASVTRERFLSWVADSLCSFSPGRSEVLAERLREAGVPHRLVKRR